MAKLLPSACDFNVSIIQEGQSKNTNLDSMSGATCRRYCQVIYLTHMHHFGLGQL